MYDPNPFAPPKGILEKIDAAGEFPVFLAKAITTIVGVTLFYAIFLLV